MKNLAAHRSREARSLELVLYHRFAGVGRGDANDSVVAQMLASWMADKSVLPRFMGLAEDRFAAMVDWHFPEIGTIAGVRDHHRPDDRFDELDDVRELLLEHRARQSESEVWIAEIVATGCMGPDHLWSDLGLFSRSYLTEMMERNFPALAARNDKNMKWKKFLYRRLCEREGFVACRAPSCEACIDYAACFAVEP